MAEKNMKIQKMETESIPKLILNYSAATFFALFFNELYNIVDTVFVSRGIGDNAMGGVSIIFPFMLIQGAISQTVGSGAATIVSKHLGSKKYEEAGKTTINAMLAFYGISIIITVTGLILINPLLKLFGATSDIMPYAKEYFTVILLGNVFSTGFSSIIRAEGKMLYSLLIWLIPTAVNVSLDAVFIYKLNMGVTGAALATVICYFTSFMMWIIFVKKFSVQKYTKAKPDLKIMTKIVSLGIPMLLQLSSISILFTFINKILSSIGGTMSINTFAYVSKIIGFAVVPFNAVTSAVSPIISYNYGAKSIKRIDKSFNFSVIFCEAYAVIAFVAAFTLSDNILSIFTDNAEIINQGVAALKALSLALPFLPVVLSVGIYFQATEKRLNAFLTNIWILIFTFIFVFIFVKLIGIHSIYYAVSAACLCACIAAIALKQRNKALY